MGKASTARGSQSAEQTNVRSLSPDQGVSHSTSLVACTVSKDVNGIGAGIH